MNRIDDLARILSPSLHDVNFTGGGPATVGGCRRQHPEGRPESLAERERRPHLKPATRLGEVASGSQPGRGVGLAAEGFAAGADRQQSISDPSVLGSRGVVLQLVVAPAIQAELRPGAEFERPTIRVDPRAVEFVVPGKHGVIGLGASYRHPVSKQWAHQAPHSEKGPGSTKEFL